MRTAPFALAVTAAWLLGAAPAMADSKMSLGSGVLLFHSEDAGISNVLAVDYDSRGRLRFVDEADPNGMSYPTPPCSPGRLNGTGNEVEVFCDKGSIKSVAVQIGPGEDRVTYKLDDLPVTLEGLVGADTLTSAGAADGVHGGQGNDTLDSGAGNDRTTGGDGDDTIRAGDGDDRIDGGAGADSIDAGAGDDTVVAAEGTTDRIDCGAGNDTVSADTRDEVTNCENVTRNEVAAPAGQPTGDDKTAPVLRAGGSTSQRVTLRRRRIVIGVTSSERALINVSGFLDAGGINDRLRPASTTIALGGAGEFVRVTLSKRQARRVLADLRRHRRAIVRLTVSAVDAAGNTSRSRRVSVWLRR